MKIRPAIKADIPAITTMKKIEDSDRYVQRVRETNDGESAYLVAEQGGLVIGQVFLKYYGTKTTPDYPNMEDLYVDEKFRDQGVGTALVSECEKLAKTQGHTQIGLSVNPNLNQEALRLYKKLGYRDLGNQPYLDGVYNGVEDWVIDLVKVI